MPILLTVAYSCNCCLFLTPFVLCILCNFMDNHSYIFPHFCNPSQQYESAIERREKIYFLNICLSSPNCCDWLLGQCGEQCQPSMWPSNKPTNHFIPVMTPFPSSLCLTKIAPRIVIPWLRTISITKGILFTNPAIIANLALSRNLWLLQSSPITSWQQWSLKNKSNISYILCMSNETLFYKKSSNAGGHEELDLGHFISVGVGQISPKSVNVKIKSNSI